MSEWQKIETAPKDGTPILVVQVWALARPMYAIVRWGCSKHLPKCTPPGADCAADWLGEIGQRYGWEFTHWSPLTEPPR